MNANSPGAADAIDLSEQRRALGRTVVQHDEANVVPLRGLGVTFHRPEPAPAPGQEIPPGWHVAYFLPSLAAWELNPDGTPKDNGVLPHMPLPRRMHVGLTMKLLEPLRVGDTLRRENTFAAIELRQGRSGPLIVSTQRRQIFSARGLAIEEDYVQAHLPAVDPALPAAPARSESAPLDAPWQRTVTPDSIDLFRYSALTFNAHRIHYDREFAVGVERQPGVVVQGMFTAQCLIDLARDRLAGARITGFSFRAVAPLFEGQPIRLLGQPEAGQKRVQLWAASPAGTVAMKAWVTHE